MLLYAVLPVINCQVNVVFEVRPVGLYDVLQVTEGSAAWAGRLVGKVGKVPWGS